MREITCPGCGEVLGVPEELEGGAIRCGVCERIIEAREQGTAGSPRRSDDRDDDRRDDEPRDRGRYRDDGDDEPRPRRRPRDRDDDYDRPKKKSGCGMWVWILGVVALLALGCCGVGTFLVFKFGDPKWERFTPPDGRWSAEFPGKPKMEIKPIEGVPGAGNATYYTGERLLKQEAYLVGHGDLPAADVRFATNDRIMNEGLEGVLKGPMNAREISRRNLKMAGTDAKELVIDVTVPNAGNGRMIVRVLVADNRIYTLIAVKMGQGANPEQAEKFFNAFTLETKK